MPRPRQNVQLQLGPGQAENVPNRLVAEGRVGRADVSRALGEMGGRSMSWSADSPRSEAQSVESVAWQAVRGGDQGDREQLHRRRTSHRYRGRDVGDRRSTRLLRRLPGCSKVGISASCVRSPRGTAVVTRRRNPRHEPLLFREARTASTASCQRRAQARPFPSTAAALPCGSLSAPARESLSQ